MAIVGISGTIGPDWSQAVRSVETRSGVNAAMTRRQATELVDELVNAVNAHDVDRIMRLYTEDAVSVSPVFGLVSGLVAIGHGWERLFSLFPDWTVFRLDILADRNRIAILGYAAATDKHGWFGQAATGERIEYRASIMLTLSDGKIQRDERIYDLSGLMQNLEKSRIDKELALAAEVQQGLFALLDSSTPFCETAADSIPCRSIGGDFFEASLLPSGDLAIALGDVAGKGPASALLAAMIQGMLSGELTKSPSPAEVCGRINRELVRRRINPRFATLMLGVLSPSGRLAYTNAGHNPPILHRSTEVHRLRVGGPVLGVLRESMYEEQSVMLKEGDALILFSDGVVEATEIGGREFGDDALVECIAGAGSLPAARTVENVLRAIRAFCADAPQHDDITVLVTRFSTFAAGPEPVRS